MPRLQRSISKSLIFVRGSSARKTGMSNLCILVRIIATEQLWIPFGRDEPQPAA